MHESMLAKLDKLQIRLSEIEGLLIDSETIKDMENYTLLNKEFADYTNILWKQILKIILKILLEEQSFV